MKAGKGLIALVLCTAALAARSAEPDTGQVVDRDTDHQQRIQAGLESGRLSPGEASELERNEARIHKAEARALKDGDFSSEDQARINRMQDRASREIERLESNGTLGDPASRSSERLQADIERSVRQQERIGRGGQSGDLTNSQVGTLQRGQARVNAREGAAESDRQLGFFEQLRARIAQKRQRHRISKEEQEPTR